jgi:hypothetical protein
VSAGFGPGSFRPVTGLGGVRAFAGLGCGGGCGCQQKGMGSMAELVKNPVFLSVALIALVGGYVVIRETVRWW